MPVRKILIAFVALTVAALAWAAQPRQAHIATAAAGVFLLIADRAFDARSEHPHAGWGVLVEGSKIAVVGQR